MQIQKYFTYQRREHSVVFTKKFFKKPSLKLDDTDCEIVKDSYSYLDWYLRGKATLNDEEFEICIYGRQIYILKDDVDIETEMPFTYPPAMVKRIYRVLLGLIYLIGICVLEYFSTKIDYDKLSIYPTSYPYILILTSIILFLHGLMGSDFIMCKPYMKKRVKMLLVNLILAGLCLWSYFLCYLLGVVS